jgi:hypothetical protein
MLNAGASGDFVQIFVLMWAVGAAVSNFFLTPV